ncbi:MAG: type I 3-dehydroquinate dehydratase [Puniceicoccales bacterium]
MKKIFLNQPHPVLTAIFAGQTPQELIATARHSEYEGADGLAASLEDLKPEYRNEDSLREIIAAVNLPWMFFFYRNDKQQELGDEERQEVLLAAALAGASVIDVMGDLYDPSERELTLNPDAIGRQNQLIAEIRARGAHAIISSHMACSRTTDEVVEHMLALEARGPDIVKIVTTVDTPDELAEAFRTTMVLKQKLKLPFVHLCNGKYSRPHRCMGPALGVSTFFAVPQYEPRYSMGQPTVRAMRAIMDNLHWNINDVSEV